MVKLKTVLITGASGYIGSFLARYLQDQGYRVRVLVRQIPDYLKNSGFEIFVGDLTEKQSLVNSCKDIDVVVHAAALNETEVSDLNKATNVNVLGTQNMIDIAVAESVKRFIKLSTFHVYTLNNLVKGIINEQTPTEPLNNYSLTLKKAEEICEKYKTKIEIVILRISNCYGAPIDYRVDRWSLLISDLCKQACLNGKICLKSDGSQKRDFVSLSDISKAIEIMINAVKSEIKDPIFNVGGEDIRSIGEVAELVSETFFKIYGKEIPVEYVTDLRTDKTKKEFIFSIEKIKKLGYKPVSDMREEIMKVMELCEEMKNGKA